MKYIITFVICLVLGIVLTTAILASCAPAQPVWEDEEGQDWVSIGSGTYWTTVRPPGYEHGACIVVFTSGTSNRAVSVDCY